MPIISGLSYRLSGCPATGTSSTYRLMLRVRSDETTNIATISQYGTGEASDGRFTATSNAKYILGEIQIYNGQNVDLTFYPQVEIIPTSSTLASAYEPYNGNTHPINLGVENLLQNNLTSDSLNGITYVVNEDKSVTLSGTASAITWLVLNTNVPLKAGTYTMSQGYTGNNIRMYSTGLGVYTSDGVRTITKATDMTGDVSINIPNGTVISTPITIYPMIEEGSKANAYTPYGTTPIELAEISTYNDEIFRTCGKNLFNGTFELGGIDINTGINDTASDRVRVKEYIPIEANAEYTISGVNGSRFAIFYDSSKTYLGYVLVDSQTTSGTFTTMPDTAYIRWYIIQTNTNIYEQLEKGSTATEYNPFGTGEWYYKEAIKKIVLDGTETIGSTSGYLAAGRFDFLGYYDGLKGSTNNPNVICNYYLSKFAQENGCIFLSGIDAHINIVDTTYINNLEGFKTWLGNVKPQVKYILATPTYTKITSSNYPTLYSQLEAIYNAQGYDNQTNISQTNNDLPFKITASALKEWAQ